MHFVDPRQRERKFTQRRQRQITAGGAVVVTVRLVGVVRIALVRVAVGRHIGPRMGMAARTMFVPLKFAPPNGRLFRLMDRRSVTFPCSMPMPEQTVVVGQPDEQGVAQQRRTEQQSDRPSQAWGSRGHWRNKGERVIGAK